MKKLIRAYSNVRMSVKSSSDSDTESGKQVNGGNSKKCLLKRGSSKGRSSVDVELTARIHSMVWPCYDLSLLQELLEKHPEELNKQSGLLKDTLLHRAVRHGKTDAVAFLISKRANVDAQNLAGQTPLHIACQLQFGESAKMLADAYADVNLGDISGDAPIHLACKGGSLPILELVMDKSLCKMGCEGHLGNSLLHYAAQYGHIDMMKYLITNGNDPNAKNFLGETPLHLAAGSHNKKVETSHVECLLEYGADLNSRTIWGDTAGHYAALSGTLEVLKYLCEEGISFTKSEDVDLNECEAVASKHNLAKEVREELSMTFLQKVAKSGCIVKSIFVLDKMMEARRIVAFNQSAIFLQNNRMQVLHHRELSGQQTEFKRMAMELRKDMNKPKSALGLFLKYSPDCIHHLLNECLVSNATDNSTDQVQGKITMDLFLFYPHKCEETGELAFVESLIKSRKQRFLTHPLIETFLKLKWYKTWKLYLFILICYGLYVFFLLGYSLIHFGNVLDEPIPINQRDFWWYALSISTFIIGIVEVIKVTYITRELIKTPKGTFKYIKHDISRFIFVILAKLRDMLIPIFSAIMLTPQVLPETRRYVCAINVILSCFTFMLALSRLPKVGIYVFMLNKVFITIVNFFTSYFWHFLGYAIAFHILMPFEGPFANLGDSVIKVLTMLMGEYDFTDTFVNPQTYWLSKLIFVVFVIDMSVVLMNLVLGLAVNDVESILQHSKVRRLMHETFTVTYLEKLCFNISNFPWICDRLNNMNITNSNVCQFKEIVYVNLVDIVHNLGNEIIIDSTMEGGEKICHPCPESVMLSIVQILKQRIPETKPPLDPRIENAISELKDQNEILNNKLNSVGQQLDTLTKMLSDRNRKNELFPLPVSSKEPHSS